MATKLRIAGLLALVCLVTLSMAAPQQTYPWQKKEFDKVPACPYGFVGKMAYPYNCVLYIECTEHTSTVKTCYPLRVFDPVQNECDWSEDHPECEDGGFIEIRDDEIRARQV